MSGIELSRRAVLALGGTVGSAGAVAGLLWNQSHQTPTLGADAYTASTAPAGSSPLLLANIDRKEPAQTATSVLYEILSSREFEAIPKAVRGMFNSSETAMDVENVGKIVYFGSEADSRASGVVIWADWQADKPANILKKESNMTVHSDTLHNQRIYTSGSTSAAILGDAVFVFGSTAVVEDTLGVWHGTGQPETGATLDAFSRTPSQAAIRFTFDSLQFNCNRLASGYSEAYETIKQGYGSVSESGTEFTLRFRVSTDGSAREVAAALQADLKEASERSEETNRRDASPKVVSQVSVSHEADTVSLLYRPVTNEHQSHAGDVLKDAVCLTGLSD
ncbi:hypothetical protein G3I44_07615 [Halogeometricum borinquense]|uniref:Uncharacterized protein n=1 Tax=Halogeometricum borinquense TaxID=60847 RepID=A0A6C0UFL7_9EURY|nr:hypothetical protein [Halogeometricum borinquense]QIB74175.1 hypothetical protein G3I44_07615 [Halogeometricum borinquense]